MGNRKSRIKAPPRGPKSRDNGALEDWDASSPTPSHHYTQEIPIPELDSNQQPPPPPFARNLSDSERSLAANLLRATCQPPWLRGKRRCLVCCDLDFRRGEDGFSPGGKARCFAHIGELSLAVRQGCPGCRFLWTVVFTLLVLNPEGINFSPNDPMSICGVVLESLVEGGPLAIIWTDGFINKLRDRITDPMRRIEVYVPGQPSVWPALGVANAVHPAACPDTSIGRSIEWLEDCIAAHPECRGPPSPLPTRILRLNPTDRGISMSLHVARVAELGTYAALSYRWDTGECVKLEHCKLEAFQRDIPFSKLSTTFQDAARIALNLGLRYLWIDALCIIQDSALDWERESSRMGDVYAGSTVTLAAESIGAYGIFGVGGSCVDLWPAFQRQFSVPARNGGQTQAMTRVTFKLADKQGEVAHRIFHGQAMTARGPSILDRRGWTLQERLLSPRVLHCSEGEFAWECLRHLRCECQVIPLPKQNQVRYRASLRNHLTANTSGGNPAVPAFPWSDVVTSFTARELTKHSDRLFAISGLAARMGAGAEERYMCGLWRDQLPLYLMWYRAARSRGTLAEPEIEDDTNHRLPSSYAPTWSWASITGTISFHTAVKRFEKSAAGEDGQKEAGHTGIAVLETRYQPSQANPFGPPLEAALHVKGPISKGTIMRYQDMIPAQVERIRNRYKAVWLSPGMDIPLGPTGTFVFSDRPDLMPAAMTPDVWCESNEVKSGDRVSLLWARDDFALVLTEVGRVTFTRVGSCTTATGDREGATVMNIWVV